VFTFFNDDDFFRKSRLHYIVPQTFSDGDGKKEDKEFGFLGEEQKKLRKN
jgi:hypothetical protein